MSAKMQVLVLYSFCSKTKMASVPSCVTRTVYTYFYTNYTYHLHLFSTSFFSLFSGAAEQQWCHSWEGVCWSKPPHPHPTPPPHIHTHTDTHRLTHPNPIYTHVSCVTLAAFRGLQIIFFFKLHLSSYVSCDQEMEITSLHWTWGCVSVFALRVYLHTAV